MRILYFSQVIFCIEVTELLPFDEICTYYSRSIPCNKEQFLGKELLGGIHIPFSGSALVFCEVVKTVFCEKGINFYHAKLFPYHWLHFHLNIQMDVHCGEGI